MRNLTKFTAALLLGLPLVLGGCDELLAPSKADILEKSESAETMREVKEALGDPDDVSKFGPVETWTYNAENGAVKIDFTGERVINRRTADKDE